jgi:hypothetical protein
MKFKDDVVAARYEDLHKYAKQLAEEMDKWSKDNHGTELTLTATVSSRDEDKELGRISDTHRTRRAFDIRTSNLSETLIEEMCTHFRKKYKNLGATTSTGSQLIVNKPHGTGGHLHVQLNRKYALPEINYGKEKS